jgi:hypothetical protein
VHDRVTQYYYHKLREGNLLMNLSIFKKICATFWVFMATLRLTQNGFAKQRDMNL